MEKAEQNRKNHLHKRRLYSAKLNQHARAKNLFWLKKEQENEYNRVMGLLTKKKTEEKKDKEKNEEQKDNNAVKDYHY